MICTVDDDYVRERVRWVATLSNGLTVYEDDDRPGLEEASAWKRLKTYCYEKHVYIVKMWLQFRSNVVLVEPIDAAGYFFVKSAFGVWGDTETFHAYIVGTLEDGVVNTVKYKVPELEVLERGQREVNVASPMLIVRNG